MANNFLKYSNMDYATVLQQFQNKLNSDPKFANFRESAIAQMMSEIFAGSLEFMSYYLDRRSSESFMDTAQLPSSVYMLSRMLGYDITRPIPANAKIKIKLKGDFSSIVASGDKLQVPFHSTFSYGGYDYILKKTLKIDLSSYVDKMNSDGSAYESSFIEFDVNGDDVEIVQGQLVEKVFEGRNNPQIGSTFQKYQIDDEEFANTFGSEDYSPETTKVWVGNTKSSSTQYIIDRRSLINWEVIDALGNENNPKVCVIKTGINGVDVDFGEARWTDYPSYTVSGGSTTIFDNIYIQYLKTKGSQGNQNGLIEKKLTFGDKVYTTQGRDITSNVEFYFKSNPVGGSDIESMDSVKMNSPNIFYSLDRLVSKPDYEAYLKTLTSPIDIKYSWAYGESDEINRLGNTDAVRKFFNLVLFSCASSLYNISNSPYSPKTGEDLNTAVLDYDYSINDLNYNNLYNVYTKQDVVQQLASYSTSGFVWTTTGETVATSAQKGQYYVSTYDDSMVVRFTYTSDQSDYSSNTSADSTVTLDVSNLGSKTDNAAMTNLASLLQEQLRLVKDTRATPTDNSNYNGTAFPNIGVSYNTANKRFTVQHILNSPCHIAQFSGTEASDIGLSDLNFELVTTDQQLSSKITDVIDKLNSRSQVTIRNVYISPVIIQLNLVGTVYVKNLYDLDDVQTTIEDDIYEFLDNNTNFATSTYLSNLTELIEVQPSVRNANIEFSAVSDTTTYYESGNNAIINGAFINADNRSDAYGFIDDKLADWITAGDFTVRSFFEDFVSSLYDRFVFEGDPFSLFAQSNTFYNLCSDVYKDNVYRIAGAMIDSNGDITNFSQNELVQIVSNLDYEYSSNT